MATNQTVFPGQSYGLLEVIEVLPGDGTKKGRIVKCKCLCGNHKNVYVKRLTGGQCKSCGCLNKANSGVQPGDKFGSLEVISLITPEEGRTNKRAYCECDCGRCTTVRLDTLVSGKVKSCGKCSTVSDEPLACPNQLIL